MTQEINFEKGFESVVEGVSAIGVSMINFSQRLNKLDKTEMSDFDRGRVIGSEMVAETVRESVMRVLKTVEDILMAVLPEETKEEAKKAFNLRSDSNTVQ